MKNQLKFINEVLNQLQTRKVNYADIRLVKTENKNIATKDGIVEALNKSFSFGFGIRIFLSAGWGFSASVLPQNLSWRQKQKLIDQVINKAYNLAQQAALFNQKPILFPSRRPIKANWKTKYKIDPFKTSDNKIISHLLKAEKALRVSKKIKVSQAFFSSRQEEKIFASTEGSLIKQKILFTGAGIEATAIEKGELQNRSYPNSFRGQFVTKGAEILAEFKLEKNAPRIGEEAVKLLAAPNCPEGQWDIIIDSNQLALQVHESIGHALEFDRILGLEASFAGTSFVKPADIGQLEYASKIVNVTADATLTGGLGSFGFDDEGIKAKRQYLIKNGRLINALTSRETAAKYNLPVTGAMRAESWENIPLVRMTNINLEPGQWDFDDLVADTKKGLFLSTNRSWSIDDKRNNFQFGTEIAYQIKNGRLGKIYKNPVYSGKTIKFWHSCDAICNKNHWQVWGTPNCGKGEPVQTMHVGHGTAPARFRKIKVFSGK